MLRSLMFLPGNSPAMLLNGAILGADGIILDLEDAVALDQKDAARELVAQALESLDFGKVELIVRINALDTEYWQKDLQAISKYNPIIMPAKLSSKEDCDKLCAYLKELGQKEIRIIPLLETALAIENAYEIAKNENVIALFLGAEDLTVDLTCKRTREGEEILYARSRIVNAAKANHKLAIDTPFADVEDLEGLKLDCQKAKSLGFDAKASISPRHIEEINNCFSPTAEEIAYARAVINAIEEGKKEGKGAVSYKGKMIDKPIVLRAESVLESAKALGLDYE